jgi:RNA ligase (TIGR02306 family)
MIMRKMASIRKIDDIRPIDGADAIECAVVGGWNVVVKKGEFAVGDLAVYCEIDSWIPTELAPFLSKGKEPREYEGVRGERLRTVKLRGQLSQGLLLNLDTALPFTNTFVEGDDVSEVLNIKKWEMQVPAQLAGQVKGNFPSLIPKTDAERIQNLTKEFKEWFHDGIEFEVTVKLDGSSMTVAKIGDDIHVCSRNLSLKLEQEGNSFVDTAKNLGLVESLNRLGKNLAIQGELCGPGIQKNQEELKQLEFFVFEIYDIDSGKYLDSLDRQKICIELGLKHVPILHEKVTLSHLNLFSVDDVLEFAEGTSLNSKVQREGVVFKNETGTIKFKSINNAWLFRNDT